MKSIVLGLLLWLNVTVPSWAVPAIPGSHGISPSLAVGAPVTFRIYYINDFHGFANSTQPPGGKGQQGGIAWLASRLKQLRTEHPGLFLVAGDVIQGDTWTNFSQGYSTIALLNQLHLDAMVTGNHEFDFGQDVLKKRISEANFPVLAANVKDLPGVYPQVSFSLSGGKVTVIGLVTDDVPQTSHPRNTKGLSFAAPLQVAREQIAAMNKNASLFVLLTHIGYEQDLALARNLCQGPDSLGVPILIVGGHSHTEVKTPVQIGNCAVVVQAGALGRFLGVVDMTVDQGQLAAVKGRVDEIVPTPRADDPEIAALVKRYNAQVDVVLNQKGGVTDVDLIQEGVRQQE
ncbi:MAG: bifunctional UDP-sugar hydrolase/5'-nucleotidase, partial [Desulfocapsaceae bacterium]|nr:bifunctional UDP-sugar hydrolase/5'-nucleotidase [Desulfocapsaceae bacterium]